MPFHVTDLSAGSGGPRLFQGIEKLLAVSASICWKAGLCSHSGGPNCVGGTSGNCRLWTAAVELEADDSGFFHGGVTCCCDVLLLAAAGAAAAAGSAMSHDASLDSGEGTLDGGPSLDGRAAEAADVRGPDFKFERMR